MTILGLDLATRTGYAIGRHDERHELDVFASDTWDLRPQRGDSPGMRYIRLRGQLVATLAAFPELQLIAYEQPHQRGGAATEVLLGLVAVVHEFAAAHFLDHTAIRTDELKRHATGMNRASKAAMIDAARDRLGRLPNTDDEADALWALHFASVHFGRK